MASPAFSATDACNLVLSAFIMLPVPIHRTGLAVAPYRPTRPIITARGELVQYAMEAPYNTARTWIESQRSQLSLCLVCYTCITLQRQYSIRCHDN